MGMSMYDRSSIYETISAFPWRAFLTGYPEYAYAPQAPRLRRIIADLEELNAAMGVRLHWSDTPSRDPEIRAEYVWTSRDMYVEDTPPLPMRAALLLHESAHAVHHMDHAWHFMQHMHESERRWVNRVETVAEAASLAAGRRIGLTLRPRGMHVLRVRSQALYAHQKEVDDAIAVSDAIAHELLHWITR